MEQGVRAVLSDIWPEQVRQAVIIIIHPGRGPVIRSQRPDRAVGDRGECAVSVIVQQRVPPGGEHSPDSNVEKTVAVVVGKGLGPAIYRDPVGYEQGICRVL